MKTWEKAALGVALVWAVGTVMEAVQDPSGAESAWVDTYKCHQAVEGELKAPATADFHDETTTERAGPGFTVRGEVDAENGFGALLTSGFTCVLSEDGSVEDVFVG